MFAVHRRENPVGTGLYRKVHERHQRGQIAMRRDQGVVDVAGMAGRVAQANDAGNFGQALQQGAERPNPSVRSLAVIGVDVLSDQGDLAHAIVGEPEHVVDNLCNGPRHLGAARVGHHAEGAEFIAAFLHRDERRDAAGADCIRPRRGQESELVLDRKFGLQRTAVALGMRQQLRQMMVTLRTDHDIDHRRAADDLLALGLRDAAGDRDAHVAAIARGFVLDDAQAPELRVNLLGGLFADVAGVENHQVRVIHAGGLDKAFRCQRVHHALRIVDIHLTTI